MLGNSGGLALLPFPLHSPSKTPSMSTFGLISVEGFAYLGAGWTYLS